MEIAKRHHVLAMQGIEQNGVLLAGELAHAVVGDRRQFVALVGRELLWLPIDRPRRRMHHALYTRFFGAQQDIQRAGRVHLEIARRIAHADGVLRAGLMKDNIGRGKVRADVFDP